MLDFSRQPNTPVTLQVGPVPDALKVGPFPDACLFKAKKDVYTSDTNKCPLYNTDIWLYKWAKQYLLTIYAAHVSFPEKYLRYLSPEYHENVRVQLC